MKDYSKIPDALKSLPDWLTWKFTPRANSEKLGKCPNVPSGPWEEKKLLTYEDALRQLARYQLPTNNYQADGIGLAFRSDSSFIGIDIDNVTETEVEKDPFVKTLLFTGRNGYIEKSVSGKGYHIIGTCSNKKILLDLFKSYNNGSGAKSSDKKIEMYASDHYFTISGDIITNNCGCIDATILLAWEYITKKSLLCSIASIINNSSIATEPKQAPSQCNGTYTPTPALATIPPPPNAFSDEEVLKLPLRPIEETIKFMYKTKPILKNILEKDGFASAQDYWKLYGRNNNAKDTSPSGFDQEIASAIMFWFYRYGVDKIVKILSESKLNRDKPLADYWFRTVSGAYERAIEFFPATYLSKLSWMEQRKLENWKNWKKEIAKQER